MPSYKYKAQAKSFLSRHGLRFRATLKGDRCPPYCDEKCIHGDRHRITIGRKGGGRLSFDFWNSFNDRQTGAEVHAYDVLASLSIEARAPDTFEDFCSDFGYDEDSRKAHDTFKLCNKLAKRLRAFFSEDELSDLAMIE